MRKLMSLLAMTVAISVVGLAAKAVEEKTIKGEAQCGKCTLKETTDCQAVVKVTEDGKTLTYYIVQNDVAKKVHSKICPPNSKATYEITGDLKKDGEKLVITPTKVEVK